MATDSVDCALAARHKSQSNLLACSTHTELLCLVELLFFVPLMTNFIGPDTYPFQSAENLICQSSAHPSALYFFQNKVHQIWIHIFKFEISRLGCVSCPLVLVCVLVHFRFNLMSSVLAPFQIG